LGRLLRVNWIISNWFRTQAYYDSGGWRATWAGEGGGVLLNQCPHNLDLLQWICGMPEKIRGFCDIGKRHNIEVEDEVTAFMEYPDGCTGLFVTSTGEAPGTNRLEIAGDQGKLVYERGKITYTRNEVSATEFLKTCPESFSRPPVWDVSIPVSGGNGGQHAEVLSNFANAIRDGSPLIAPAEQGINSVELANAMLYSSIKGKPIDLPLDSAQYEAVLKTLIAGSSFVKQTTEQTTTDMSQSFNT
jgi:predicted dehydrogenase